MGTSIASADTSEARYLPATTSTGETGSVSSVSIVPLRSSSLNTRMVSAGIKRLNRSGSISKKLRSSATPAIKNTEKNNIPENTRKSPQTIYATGLEKYEASSRPMMTAQGLLVFMLLTSHSQRPEHIL